MTPTAPHVHRGGTSRESLREQYGIAYSAVADAIRAVEENGPNKRDYYPIGEIAWRRALDEHKARLAKLREVYEELFAIVVALDEATP